MLVADQPAWGLEHRFVVPGGLHQVPVRTRLPLALNAINYAISTPRQSACLRRGWRVLAHYARAGLPITSLRQRECGC